jgi:hypothetical protein
MLDVRFEVYRIQHVLAPATVHMRECARVSSVFGVEEHIDFIRFTLRIELLTQTNNLHFHMLQARLFFTPSTLTVNVRAARGMTPWQEGEAAREEEADELVMLLGH